MVKRALLAAIGVLTVALVLPVFAQQPATIVLRSGERISGDLVDFGGVGYTIRVDGRDRTVTPNDVAVVEMNQRQLTSEQQAQLSAGRPFVLLTTGEVVNGRLYDIGGTRPLWFLIDTATGRREFSGNEIAGLFLANPANATPPAVATSGVVPAGAIVVPGNRQWTPTNIRVRAGEWWDFDVTGVVQYTSDVNERAERQGSIPQRTFPGSPLPNEFAGALIGRIDNGSPFLLGGYPQVRMPATGTLDLGINDDYVNDNSGQFYVVMKRHQ